MPPPADMPDMAPAPNWSNGSGGKTGDTTQHMMSGGNDRLFAVHTPSFYDPAVGVPLVVHFHGWRPLPAGVLAEIRSVWSKQADAQTFIAVAPEGLPCPELDPGGPPYGCFSLSTDKGFVNELVDLIQASYNIDLDRIYLSGHSGGSFFDQSLALALPDRFAAAVEFSGGCISESDKYGNSCSVYAKYDQTASRKLPFYLVHNPDDMVVPPYYSSDLLDLLNADGHVTKSYFMSYDGGDTGHSIDPTLVPDVWTFLSMYTRPRPTM
jgi:poly(3-hydroxybutyrate) depolymerase